MVTIESGMQYQYHNNFREFFRYGLDAFETYCNSAYGENFETLSAANQVQALTDLYNNKPTSLQQHHPPGLLLRGLRDGLVWLLHGPDLRGEQGHGRLGLLGLQRE